MKASLNRLSKPELFTSFYQQALVLGLLVLTFLISLYSEYRQYQHICKYDDYVTEVWVNKQYKKKDYWVFELKSVEGFHFYTSSKEDVKPLHGQYLKVKMFIDDLDFLSYLRGFYAPSYLMAKLPYHQQRFEFIGELKTLHSSKIASIYGALFFADTVPLDQRGQLSAWGVNHLLAISGFHLGVLSLVLFFILKLLYIPVQSKYFPYRNSRRDIALCVMGLLFWYVWFLDFTPSLLRAFSMSLFAYLLYDRGVKLVSFSSLFLVVAALIALWPKLMFSLGFWFSVAGVFYILLFLYYTKGLRAWQSFILVHGWVYVAMIPIVHYFFGSFSVYQLFSPFLTMLFILFYPLALLSHIIGFSDLLDPVLEYLLGFDILVAEYYTPRYFFFGYILTSLLAVHKRIFFFLTLLFSMMLLIYFLYGIAQF